MKQPVLIIDKKEKDLPKHIIPYTYRHYCPICGKKSMEFYINYNKKTKLYSFINPNMEDFDLDWTQLYMDMVCVVASARHNMLFITEEIEWSMDKEKEFDRYISLSDDQFKIFSMNKNLFYKILKTIHNELYSKINLKFIAKERKYMDYVSRPNFCSKECVEKFILSVFEDIKNSKEVKP